MRKKLTIIFILSFTLLLSCWIGTRFIEKGRINQILRNGKLIGTMYPINMYFSEDAYCVIVFTNGKPMKCVEFSEARQLTRTIDLEPVTIFDLQYFCGMRLSQIENELGPYHMDIGSGYFMPSYITCDGYLVSFTFMAGEERVTHIGKTDLFTGESIEWILTDKEE